MPIRWYGSGNNDDPIYKHFSRVVNFILHAMGFAAINSGLWFWQQMRHPWSHLSWLSETWFAILVLHLLIVIFLKPESSKSVTPPLAQE